MIHYTLNTGHSRTSPRSEVGDDVLPVCRPLLAVGDHPLPNDPAYTLTVPIVKHGWAGTVRRGQRPIITFAVADTPEAEAEIWPQLEALYLRLTDQRPFAAADFQAPRKPDSLPWCAAVTILPDRAMDWLGDIERCMAWAYLESRADGRES